MIYVHFQGIEKIRAKLDPIKYQNAINRGFSISGKVVKGGVQTETPVKTGHLQKGWNIYDGNMQTIIENRVFYGPYVNNGTKYMKGNPFMERGLQKTAQKVAFIVFGELRKVLAA